MIRFEMFSARRRLTWVGCALMVLAGCVQRPGADAPVVLAPGAVAGTNSAVLLPGGDYHLVTVRQRDAGRPAVLCSEPSPDWAVAFGTALGGSLSVGIEGAGNGSVSGNRATTEAVTAMLGRTAGVVALRDGLYSACQAYANGVIGRDAYALILSQYGNLLVALAGSGGGGGSGGSGASTPAAGGVAVAVSTGGSGGVAPTTQSTGGGSSAATGAAAQLQKELVQALLVSCISSHDQTLSYVAPNTFLAEACRSVQSALDSALPMLLAPPGTAAPAPAATSSRRRGAS